MPEKETGTASFSGMSGQTFERRRGAYRLLSCKKRKRQGSLKKLRLSPKDKNEKPVFFAGRFRPCPDNADGRRGILQRGGFL